MNALRLLATAALASAALLPARVLLKQDFDDLKPGPMGNTPHWRIQRANPQDFAVVAGPAASAPHAMKVLRQTLPGSAALRLRPAAGQDFTFECKVRVPSGNGIVLHFLQDRAPRPFAGVLLQAGAAPSGYDAKQRWQKSQGLPALPADAWVTFRLAFDAAAKAYRLAVDGQNGTTDYPVTIDGTCDEVRFINILPKGGHSFVDDILATQPDAAPTPPDARVLLKQDFDGAPFAPGPMGNTPHWRIYRSNPGDFTIVSSPAASAPHAMKVLRQTLPGSAALRFRPADGYDFTVECKVLLPTGNGIVLHLLQDRAARPFAGVLLQAARKPSGYTANQGWLGDQDLPALPVDEWFTFRLSFDSAARCYRLAFIDSTGLHEGKAAYPVVIDGLCDEIRFINILPKGCHSFVDDIVITQGERPALAGRTFLNPRASATPPTLAALLAGQGQARHDAAPGAPVEIEVSPEADLGAVLLAAADNRPLPKFSLKAMNSLGHWVALGDAFSCDANGFLALPPARKLVKLQITFAAPVVLAACRLYSPLAAGQGALDQEFARKLDAEYRLPVYDRQYPGHDRARLTLVNHTAQPLPVRITLQERATAKDFGAREATLPPGATDLFFDLKTMPNGEYLTRISDNSDPAATRHGTLERLLRHRTSPPCTASPRREVTGQKIFFPDGFYLAEHQGVSFVPGTAEKHLVVQGKPGEDDPYIYMGENIFLDRDGRVRVNYHTQDRLWRIASTRPFNAVALDGTLDRWQVAEGRADVPPQSRPSDPRLPAAARPDWHRKPGPDGKIAYHFYDPAKDGPVKLSQVNLDMISPAAPGTAGYQQYDWQVLRPAACTIWPVWYKAPGEAVILSRTPLVDTFPPSGALEPPNSGSDLGFGQWLSDDGKTLFMGHGRHLIRSMPYVARYDNLHDRARIVAVWRTTDGLHWEQNYVAPPSENLPPADQSYGGRQVRVPDGAGLQIAFFNRYSAFYQQISWEIIYSWDGFRWTRFQDQPQFMPNGPFGDWFHGGGYIGGTAVEKDGKYYYLMCWCNDHYHFQSEIVHGSAKTAAGFTADYMKRRYAPRHLEEWPFFQKNFGGDWEKLAAHTRAATSAIGVAVFRKDGYFSANAGDTPARLLTVPLRANGALKVNAAVGQGGHLVIRLLQNGRPLPGFEKRLGPCDGVELAVFPALPQGDFQVEVTMRNTRLYTLIF